MWIVGIILFNIIVAVLLEGFLGAIQRAEREENRQQEREAMQRAAGPLDPLLASLANFSSPTHLDSQIRLLFQLMDVDDSGSLSFHEMQEGMESLPLSPNVILSIEDWDSLTIGGEALDENQCMTAEAFQTAIRWQLMLYGQRLLAQRMSQAIQSDSDDPTTIFAMKICLMNVCQVPKMYDLDLKSLNGRENGQANNSPALKWDESHQATQVPGLQSIERKLDAIAKTIEVESRRAEEAINMAKEARDVSRSVLEYLHAQNQNSPESKTRNVDSARKSWIAPKTLTGRLSVDKMRGEQLGSRLQSMELAVDSVARGQGSSPLRPFAAMSWAEVSLGRGEDSERVGGERLTTEFGKRTV